MNRPAVSIVVPTYKRASLLPRMIDSVLNQTFEDWELIIVDGMSRDGTSELVRGYVDRFGDRIRFIEQENQGCCGARNTGIDVARGTFVALLDSDDEFLPTKLERQVELFRRCPDLGFVYSDYAAIDLSGDRRESVMDVQCPVGRSVPMRSVSDSVGSGSTAMYLCPDDLFEYLIQEYFVATIVGMVRREVLSDDIRFLENDMYGCEWMFFLEIVRRTRCGYVDEPLCLHHWVEGSLARSNPTRNMIYHRRLLLTMLERFSDTSAASMTHMQRQLGETCQQLGMQAYKSAEYGSACKYFRDALGATPGIRTGIHLAQSVVRWMVAGGKPGREPLLRFDPFASGANA